jgi:hypothetical protein
MITIAGSMPGKPYSVENEVWTATLALKNEAANSLTPSYGRVDRLREPFVCDVSLR